MSKHRLLLADDSVTIQKVVNLTFADEGIEVISVGDGNSAMEKFVETTPDLVMVDVNMPGVDGYRICEIIKQDEETKNVPVILLVGSFEPFDEEEARRVGANDYLTKPFQSIRQLVNKVTVLLNKSNGSEASAQSQETGIKSQEPEIQLEEEIPFNNTASFNTTPDLNLPPPAVTNQIFEPLGDPGFDDEMIQANQVGSLPTSEVPKFETNKDEFRIDPQQNPLQSPTYETPSQQIFEGNQEAVKTQAYTADEFKEIASLNPEENYQAPNSLPTFSDERVSAEEKAISLENEVTSEFTVPAEPTIPVVENQTPEMPKVSDEIPVLKTFSVEEFFTPKETVTQTPVEETPQEKGFAIEDFDRPFTFPQEQEVSPIPSGNASEIQQIPADYTEKAEPVFSTPEPVSEFVETEEQVSYSEPETSEIQEIYQPEKYAETSFSDLGQISEPEIPKQAETAPVSFDSAEITEPSEKITDWEVASEPPSFIADSTQSSYYDVAEPVVNEPEKVNEEPVYFQEENVFEEPKISETAQVEHSEVVSEPETVLQEMAQAEENVQQYPFEQKTSDEQILSEIETVTAETSEAPQTVEPQQFADAEQVETETVSETFEPEAEPFSAITEEPVQEVVEETQTIFPDAEETEQKYDSTEEISEPEQNFSSNEEITEPEQSFSSEVEAAEPETISEETQSFVEEDTMPTVEIPTAFPTVEEMSSIEEEPLEIEPKEEKVEQKVNTLVSGKETSEAVESVIVSEFARHSISLSAEAVETIASRIADKISEKIVQKLADDVVGNLADRIAEKLERKKQE